jgi:UDP-N-acetylmuramate--alanine ligase
MSSSRLESPQRVHIVGIGGAGMSAIATVLVGMGHQVSGSDLKQSAALERLRRLGVSTFVGHGADQIGDADLVAASSAVGRDNAEVATARARRIPVLSRAELLATICTQRRTIAVAGTHGKTTTASMLALILVESGMRPSFVIGGDIYEFGANAAWDEGEWLVVEADESDGTFLLLPKEIAVVTSVEADHLDHFGSEEELVAAFARFAQDSRRCVVSIDDPGARSVAPGNSTTFGFDEAADLRVTDFTAERSRAHFVLQRRGEGSMPIELAVPGRHNARNAAAAAAVALGTGVDPDAISRALARFGGVARRFEFRGEFAGATVIDDYAHLPGEVAAAIDAARGGGFRRVVCVFQPHRYSRVAALGPRFADAFVGADEVVITDVYAAWETPVPGISGRVVFDAVRHAHPEGSVHYVADRHELAGVVRELVRPGDCLLMLGAGDITEVTAALIDRSEERTLR